MRPDFLSGGGVRSWIGWFFQILYRMGQLKPISFISYRSVYAEVEA